MLSRNEYALRCVIWTLSSLLFVPTISHAGSLSFSGFGTLGYSYENVDNLDYKRDISQPNTRDTSGSFEQDSLLAAQWTYSANDHWSGTAQLMLDSNIEMEWRDFVKWAYISYTPDSVWTIRAGILGADIFSLGDARLIDYAHPWVRPPMEVYSWAPVYDMLGVDATARFYAFDTFWTTKLQYGQHDSHFSLNGIEKGIPFTGKHFTTLSVVNEYDFFTFRGALATLQISSDLPESMLPARDALEQIISAGNTLPKADDIYKDLGTEDEWIRFAQLSTQYDNYRWFAMAEMAYIDSDVKPVPSGIGGYVSTGYRWQNWTPYVTVSGFKAHDDAYPDMAGWGSMEGLYSQLSGTLNKMRMEQASTSLGMRYDLENSMALTAQWDHYWVAENGYGLWSGSGNGLSSSQEIDLFSLSLSFLF